MKTKGKAEKAEKADNYNNYVRKNLKSGGSSKKLNRTTSRTSMAKQRWMNRNNEAGNSGGGKYGKYNKYKKGGGYNGGGGNDNDDNNTGSANNNNSYNKPRGLQQWGLDALEMSLNLIEQQQQALEPENTADSNGMNAASHRVVNTNKSAVNKGGIVLEDSDGEDEGEEEDQANASEVDMVIDQPIQAHSVSRRSNNTAQAAAKRNVSATTGSTSGQQSTSTSTSTTAFKSHPTTTALATTYLTLPTSLLSSIHTNRTTKLSKQSAKLHKAELKQAQRILDNERVTNMTLCAPKCPGHSMPSKLLVVKKSGANKVRFALVCIIFSVVCICPVFRRVDANTQFIFHLQCCVYHTSILIHHTTQCIFLQPVLTCLISPHSHFGRASTSTAVPSRQSSAVTFSCGQR